MKICTWQHLPKYIRCVYLSLFSLGDVKQYVASESAFFNEFPEKGLRFSSSVCLCLIWIRILKHVSQNANEAVEHLEFHHLSTVAYMDGFCDSLQSICIASPVKQPAGGKHRLSDILLDESDSSNENERTNNIKQSKVVWNSNTGNDALPTPSAISLNEVVDRTSSSKEKSKKLKKARKH